MVRFLCCLGLLAFPLFGYDKTTPDAEDYYDRLELPINANVQTIIFKYREMSRVVHPDVNPGDSKADLRFRRLTEAKDNLVDITKRRAYNRTKGYPDPQLEASFRRFYRQTSNPDQFYSVLEERIRLKGSQTGLSLEHRDALKAYVDRLGSSSAGTTWERVFNILDNSMTILSSARIYGSQAVEPLKVFMLLVKDEFLFSDPPVDHFLYFFDRLTQYNVLTRDELHDYLEEYLARIQFREDFLRLVMHTFPFTTPEKTDEPALQKLLLGRIAIAQSLPIRYLPEEAEDATEAEIQAQSGAKGGKTKAKGTKPKKTAPKDTTQFPLARTASNPDALGEIFTYASEMFIQYPINEIGHKYTNSTASLCYNRAVRPLLNLLAKLPPRESSLKAINVLLEQYEDLSKGSGSVAEPLRILCHSIVYDMVEADKTGALWQYAMDRPLLHEAMQEHETRLNCDEGIARAAAAAAAAAAPTKKIVKAGGATAEGSPFPDDLADLLSRIFGEWFGNR